MKSIMTYVVTDSCIRCKYMDCVDVCPVDCFHEGENMLVIDPLVCIDCGVCEIECPIQAIIPDTQERAISWLDLNKKYATLWPVIMKKSDPPIDADDWAKVEEKYPYHFSSKPGLSSKK